MTSAVESFGRLSAGLLCAGCSAWRRHRLVDPVIPRTRRRGDGVADRRIERHGGEPHSDLIFVRPARPPAWIVTGPEKTA